MRTDIPAATDPTLLSRASVTVTMYKTATPGEVLLGTATGGVDLSTYVESLRHGDASGSMRLRYHRELALTADQPVAGSVLSIKVGGLVAFNGIVDRVGINEARGDKVLNVSFRSRGGLPAFREYRRMTPPYTVGSDIAVIARDMAEAVGLTSAEYDLPGSGLTLPHDTAQLIDLTAWDVLALVLWPSLRGPLVDARGFLKAVSRDVQAAPTIELGLEQIDSQSGSVGTLPLTAFRLKWLDPALRKVYQQERALTSVEMTAGFFCFYQSKEVWWSQDQTLRADDVVMVVKQSVNSGGVGGIIPVATEEFAVTSERGGKLELFATGFQQGMAVAGLAGLIAANWIPEAVQTVPVEGTGFTLPGARQVAKGVAETAMWAAVMSIGTGIYEFRGKAFDMVHAINEVEAYDENADEWLAKIEETSCDFIPDEATAVSVATNELIFRARLANASGLLIADDLRIEPGDVLGLPDGRRFMVTGYERDLSRGAKALLDVGGFYL